MAGFIRREFVFNVRPSSQPVREGSLPLLNFVHVLSLPCLFQAWSPRTSDGFTKMALIWTYPISPHASLPWAYLLMAPKVGCPTPKSLTGNVSCIAVSPW